MDMNAEKPTMKIRYGSYELLVMSFELFQNNVKLYLRKVQTIKEWESSSTTKGVRSFLGLANLYRKFIKDFLALAKPFFELPTKELSFEWQHEQQEVVFRIKEKLSTTCVEISQLS
jgi:hypothetical protein